MQKIILGLIFFISPLFLLAHNALSAVYKLEGISNGNVLNVSLTQSGVNKVLKDIHGVDFLKNIDQKKLKELIVNYIKENFNLKVNNRKIELTKGGIRLGNHQTDLTFITSYIPKKIDLVELEITAFKNNKGHHNIFFFNRDGLGEKIILSSKNNFKSEIDFNENLTNSKTKKPSNTKYIYWVFFIATLLLTTLGVWYLKFKKQVF